MNLLEPAAIDPLVVHESGTHAAAAIGMAAGAVVLLEQPLAGIHRLGVVVVRRGARIDGDEAVIHARVERGIDDPWRSRPPRARQRRRVLAAAAPAAAIAAARAQLQCGSENTYSVPPAVVYFGRSDMALIMPSAAEPSRGSTGPETTAPDQPPTPDSTAMY